MLLVCLLRSLAIIIVKSTNLVIVIIRRRVERRVGVTSKRRTLVDGREAARLYCGV